MRKLIVTQAHGFTTESLRIEERKMQVCFLSSALWRFDGHGRILGHRGRKYLGNLSSIRLYVCKNVQPKRANRVSSS